MTEYPCLVREGDENGPRCTRAATTHLAVRDEEQARQVIVCDEHLAEVLSYADEGEIVWHPLGEACTSPHPARWTTRDPGPGSFCQTNVDRREQQRNGDLVRRLDADGGPTYGR